MTNKITLVASAKDAASGPLAKIRKSTDDLGTSSVKTGGKLKGMSSILTSVGKAAAVAGVALIAAGVLAGKELLTLGTRLEQQDAKAKTVFGGQIGLVDKWAKANAGAMGLTGREATGLAASFADLLIPMKFSREEAAKMATDVVGLSGALSQWSGGTKSAAEVSEILAAAMLGEREALKSLGISITDADVKARLLKNGTSGLTGAQLEQAKATATQQLIFEKSQDAQDAYAKSSGSLMGKQAQVTAKFKEMIDSLAIGLIPVFHTVVTFVMDKVVPAIASIIGKIQTWMSENKPLIDQLTKFAGGVLSTLVAALGNVIGIIGGLIDKITSNKDVMNALKAWVGFLATAFDKVTTAAGFVIGKVVSFFDKLTKNKGVIKAFKDAVDGVKKAFGFVRDAIGFVIDKIASLIRWVKDAITWLNELNSKDRAYSAGKGAGSINYQPKAAGGPVAAGSNYLVGERGPEMFVPMTAGTIVPNHALGAGGGGGVTINLAYSPQYSTATVAEAHRFARAILPGLQSVVRSSRTKLG